jgi:NADPH:quinone reductase
MTTSNTKAFTGLQLRSLVKPTGELELSLVSVDTPAPAPDEVVVRVQATPLNPSDIGLLFGAADVSTASLQGSGAECVMTMKIPDALMKSMAARLNQSMPVGNEGAGVVVAAGASAAAQALLGKTVSILAGAMYSQYPLGQSRFLSRVASGCKRC